MHHAPKSCLLALLLVAALPVSVVPPVHADLFKKAKKAAQKAGNAVADEANDVAKDVAKGSKSVLSSDEVKAVTAAANKSYAATAKAGESAYRQSVSTVESGMDAAKKAALKAAGEAYIKKYKSFLEKFRRNLDALAEDDKAVAIVHRLIKASSEKRMDAEVDADMLVIGERLGMLEWKPNSIVPGSASGAFKSSWGLTVNVEGGLGIGAGGSFGIIGNCYNEPDKPYHAGLLASVGGAAGLVAGASGQVTFFWQPGGIPDAEGASVGMGFEAAIGPVGGTIGLQWSVYEGMKGAAAATPGFYLGWASGVKAKAGAIEGGYTWTIKRVTK